MKTEYFCCETNPPEPYFCPHCYFKTDLSFILRNHLLLHKNSQNHLQDHTFNIYNCEKCTFRTFSVLFLTKHLFGDCRSKKCPKWHECGQCDCRCSARAILYRQKGAKAKHDDKKWFECGQCDRKCRSKSNLYSHQKAKHKDSGEWLQCDLCAYRCKFASNLKMHVEFRHTKPADKKWFECGQCERKFLHEKHLREHRRYKHPSGEIEWFGCEQCPYRGKSESLLRKHEMTRHFVKDGEGKWYKCGQESREKKDDLKTHINSKYKSIRQRLTGFWSEDQCGG